MQSARSQHSFGLVNSENVLLETGGHTNVGYFEHQEKPRFLFAESNSKRRR